jgi:GxxExxY protein
MRVELARQSLKVRQQVAIQVYYEGEVVGEFVPDLCVEDRVLAELKAVLSLQKEYEAQLVNYLTATKVDTGLLINFGPSVEIKRKVRTYKPSAKAAG